MRQPSTAERILAVLQREHGFGLTGRQIAERLELSATTVERHMRRLWRDGKVASGAMGWTRKGDERR